MTIIAALKDGPHVWIGADSRVSWNGFVYPYQVEKWVECGRWLFAVAGSTRLGNLLSRFGPSDDAPDHAMVDALLSLIRDDNWNPDTASGPKHYGVSILAVTPDRRVLDISGSGAFADVGDAFAASGSGDQYAYGAAFACGLLADPEEKMRVALNAACQFDAGCGGKLTVRRV